MSFSLTQDVVFNNNDLIAKYNLRVRVPVEMHVFHISSITLYTII